MSSYQTWLFFILIPFFLVMAYRYRIRQIRKEENFKQQLAELEMANLRAQINPHFIFNCLNAIKGFIIENKVNAGTTYVSRFAQLFRMILNHSKERLIPLAKEIEAIRLYICIIY